MARKFGFSRKSLDSLAKRLGIGKKLPHQGKNTWLGCINEDEQSWATMEAYNKHDVWLLNEVWGRLAAYADVKPNMQHWTGNNTCVNPRCGSSNIQRRGVSRTHAQVYQRYMCTDCGKYARALLADERKPPMSNWAPVDWLLDAISLMKKWKTQGYLIMSDDELLDTLSDYPADFQERIYRIMGDK